MLFCLAVCLSSLASGCTWLMASRSGALGSVSPDWNSRSHEEKHQPSASYFSDPVMSFPCCTFPWGSDSPRVGWAGCREAGAVVSGVCGGITLPIATFLWLSWQLRTHCWISEGTETCHLLESENSLEVHFLRDRVTHGQKWPQQGSLCKEECSPA